MTARAILTRVRGIEHLLYEFGQRRNDTGIDYETLERENLSGEC